MQVSVLIMAGGRGERFWPKSRGMMPKQFLSLTSNGKTMLQLTVERSLCITDISKIFVVTNIAYKNIVENQVPDLPKCNILCEPIARNTAPCIAFAASIIKELIGDSIMAVFPSDHLVKNIHKFEHVVKSAISAANSGDYLVTIGIVPSYPETGYGYIRFDKEGIVHGCYKVRSFIEKPDIQTAESYIANGEYLWNSGIFIWKASLILEKFSQLMPDVYEGCLRIKKFYRTPDFESILKYEFERMHSESIDYGVMEKSDGILVISGDFGWDDVGSWLAIERINSVDSQNNTMLGEYVCIDSTNCTIVGDKRLIAAVGLKGIVIVDTEDAVLVCGKNRTQDIKKVIAELKENKKAQYL